jgi:signal recognition particle receptor subunit beta
MPIYDPFEQRMVVRIVYDGVACAGKTTNLRQLCTLFAAQRRSKVESPSELNGRTLYFDWMQIMAGVVSGFPLLCHIVSVPGQVVLTPRRRYLLSTADVVVYVCESTESSLEAARAGIALYDEIARERGALLPLVVQANKQDLVGARDGATLARALGRDGVPVVDGIASDGVGVVDTFVTAVRTVARAIHERAERGDLRLDVRRAETAAAVLAEVAKQEIDPEWAAEMLLEEAQGALLVEEANAIVEDEGAREQFAAAAVELGRIEARTEPATAPAPASLDAPVLPSPDVPTGFIWPAHTGRAIVRALGLDRSTRVALEDGAFVHTARDHVVRTAPLLRFFDAEAARQALVRTARECTQLERLLVPETVLVAQPASDGACWIWTVRPNIPTIAQLLARRAAGRELLAAYGVAVVEALRTALRRGVSLDLSPSSFGVQQGVMRYVGDVAAEPPTATAISTAIFGAASTIEAAGADIGAFLDAFERERERRLTAEERARTAVLGRMSEGA